MNSDTEVTLTKGLTRQKKKKPGIIYLTTIPERTQVFEIRDIFGQFGELGRVFLQEDTKRSVGKKRLKVFTEGWVEFKSKRIAKEVARLLNNSKIGVKKRSKFYDHVWSIKYLPRFKWTHLNERLAYERAVHKQRLRTEVAQAKREADFFSYNVDRSEKLKKIKASGTNEAGPVVKIRQRETEGQILQKKKAKRGTTENDRDDFLKQLFSK